MKDLGSIKGAGLPQAAEARLEQWRLRIRGLHDSVQATEARLRTVALQASAPAAADEADLTPPPSPSGVEVTAGLSFVFIETDPPQFEQGHGYLRTLVYGAKYLSGALPTFANAVKVHEFAGNVSSFPSDLGTQWHLWLTWVSSEGVESSVPEGGTNGHQVTTGKIGTADLGDLIVTAGKLADGSITAGKLAAQAIDATKFANGLEPIALVTAVPTVKSTNTVFNSTDGKLYRSDGSAYASRVPTVDLVGQIGTAQIADAALTTAKFAAGLRPVEIVTALPSTGNFEGRLAYLTTDDKVYRHNGSAWLSTVPAADITGTLVATQIADGAVTAIKTTIAAINAATGGLASNTVDAAQLVTNSVSALKITAGAVTAVKTAIAAIDPSTGNLTANSVTATQIAAGAVTAAKIAADTITANEIAANAVGVNELAAGAVTTGKLAAGAVTTAALAAGAVTANEIAAGTITGAKIAAGAIGTNELAVNSITAGKIAAGAVTTAQIAAGAITTDKLLVTGTGAALNDDPGCQDPSAWQYGDHGSGAVQTTVSDGVFGNRTWRSPTGGQASADSRFVPVSSGKVYRVSCYARRTSDSTGGLFLRLVDQSGAQVTLGIEQVDPGTAWQKIAATYTPSGVKSARVRVILNWTSSTGWMEATDIRIEEMAGADLIVNGAITTQKLAADAVTANEIAANTIIGSKIAANTISGANMVAGSIGTNELAANSITAGKIQAGAVTATQVAAGAITTDKLLVTGQGRALNDDPACSDLSAWSIPQASAAVITGAGAPVGTTVLRATNGTQIISRTFPVEAGKTYKVSLWARQVSGGGVLYVRLYCYNAANTFISYVVTGITPTSGPLEGLTVPGAWTRYSGFIVPGGGSVYAQVFLHINWATTGVSDVTDLRCEEYVGSDLIVDGSIVASKLAANAIAVGSAAIQNGAIVNAMLGDAAITTAKIADLSVVNAKLGDASVTVAKIADANITTAKIADASITNAKVANLDAAKIDAGTLDAARIAVNSLNANRITAGTITTDRIVVGAATASATSSFDSGSNVFGSPGSSSTAVTSANLAFTSTGAAVTVVCTLVLIANPANTAIQRVSVTAALRVDGSALDLLPNITILPVMAISGGVVASNKFVFTARHSPAAGTHNYNVSLSFDLRNSSNTAVTPNGGTWSYEVDIIAQENKV
jgi:trimeric autotransporter adhesin